MGPYVKFKNTMMRKLVSGSELWAPNGFSMIFMFANVWLFDDMVNSYELQAKQNIEYYWGHITKSEDCHDDLRGSQGRNIEY